MVRWLSSRPEVALFILFLGVYGYFYQAGGWNQNVRFDLTRSIVEEHTSAIDSYYRNTGDLSCRGPKGRCTRPNPRRGRHAYCDKAPGVSWLAVPMYGAVYAVAGSQEPGPDYLSAAAHLSTVFAISVPSALGAIVLFWLLEALGLSLSRRLALTLAYGLGTLAFPYSTMMYGHQLMGSLILAGFALLIRARRMPGPPEASNAATDAVTDAATGNARASVRPPTLFAAGLLLGLGVVVEYPAGLAVVPICVYAASFVRPWPQLGWLVLGGAIPAIMLASYHWAVFGGPLALPYEFSTQPHRGQGYFMGIGAPQWGPLQDILFSSYRGLFYSAPWLLLAIPGAVLLWRRARWRAEVGVCAAIIVLYIWLNASLVDWHAGWALGARYLIPTLPLFTLLCAGVFLVHLRNRLWAIGAWLGFIALAGYSAFLMLVGTAVKPEVPVYIKRPFQKFLFENFYDGKLALNTQSIDSIAASRSGERFAFNLGELMGLDGLVSLIPLFFFVVAVGAWLWHCVRRASSPERDVGAARRRSRTEGRQ